LKECEEHILQIFGDRLEEDTTPEENSA
jgi:hypothetical protein